MTPAFAALRAIAAGRLPADNALLQNCRLEGFGTRAFGREPILDLFRRSPFDLVETPDVLESPKSLLAVREGRAIFADLHEGRLTRLWVLGMEALDAAEPAVSVPRDLDLSQFEGGAVFDQADHPDLDDPGGATISRLTRPGQLAALGLPAFSLRVFVIRAFSIEGRTAALLVCAGALDAVARKPFSVNLALLSDTSTEDGAAALLVLDRAGLVASSQSAWTPRL